jgi:hypothetical protein
LTKQNLDEYLDRIANYLIKEKYTPYFELFKEKFSMVLPLAVLNFITITYRFYPNSFGLTRSHSSPRARMTSRTRTSWMCCKSRGRARTVSGSRCSSRTRPTRFGQNSWRSQQVCYSYTFVSNRCEQYSI